MLASARGLDRCRIPRFDMTSFSPRANGWTTLQPKSSVHVQSSNEIRWVERGPNVALAAEAALHLGADEKWRWEIGTWSSGSGEGLASMAEVRSFYS
jgi:hypothetical protein